MPDLLATLQRIEVQAAALASLPDAESRLHHALMLLAELHP